MELDYSTKHQQCFDIAIVKLKNQITAIYLKTF